MSAEGDILNAVGDLQSSASSMFRTKGTPLRVDLNDPESRTERLENDVQSLLNGLREAGRLIDELKRRLADLEVSSK